MGGAKDRLADTIATIVAWILFALYATALAFTTVAIYLLVLLRVVYPLLGIGA